MQRDNGAAERYMAAMVHYYDATRIPAEPGQAAGVRRDMARDPAHWGHAMVADLHALFRGRRVLELACGMGRWTQFVAESAAFVLATDTSPNLLRNAAGLNLPPDRVRFALHDAMDVEAITEPVDAAFHANFVNHLPADVRAEFHARLHRRVGRGALVVAAGQQYSDRWRKQMYAKPGSPDTYATRTDDGVTVELVDNEYDEARLRAELGATADGLQFRAGPGFWWAWYHVAG